MARPRFSPRAFLTSTPAAEVHRPAPEPDPTPATWGWHTPVPVPVVVAAAMLGFALTYGALLAFNVLQRHIGGYPLSPALAELLVVGGVALSAVAVLRRIRRLPWALLAPVGTAPRTGVVCPVAGCPVRARLSGFLTALLALGLFACSSQPLPPDWEPLSAGVTNFAVACGRLMEAEPEKTTLERRPWVDQLETQQPPPELGDFWEAKVAGARRDSGQSAYYTEGEAIADLGHRERRVLADKGCIDSASLWLGVSRDRAEERLEAGFGQGDGTTRLEYASACADIGDTLPLGPYLVPKLDYYAHWLGELHPPDGLKNFHRAATRFYRRLPEGDLVLRPAKALGEGWQVVSEGFIAAKRDLGCAHSGTADTDWVPEVTGCCPSARGERLPVCCDD